jgi:hypothetical protein
MDVNFEDGYAMSSDPISPEIRTSATFQEAFLALRQGTLEQLRGFQARTLHHLTVDQGLRVKGRKYEHLMGALAKYVTLAFVFGILSI